jgi:hypothetical protein
MALIGNGFRHYTIGRIIGSTLIDGAVCDAINQGFTQSGRMDNRTIGDGYGTDGELISYPDDMNVPYSYSPMQTAGRMASYSTIIGDGAVSANMILTLQAMAELIGSGDIEGLGGLIVQLFADIAGSGEISDADMKAFLLMVASISGSGDIEADISALAQLISNLTGAGDSSSTLSGTGSMSADILSYGELTPEGIRDSIWNALSAQYDKTGTMGEKLNDAGSASNPWSETLEGTYTAADMMRIVTAVLAGKVSGGGTGIETFRDINDTKDRVVSTVDSNGNRTSVTIDGA